MKMTPEIIQKLLPEQLETPESIESKYQDRQLPAEAMVTRIAPSPTGFMHVGTLYAALINERFAHQSNGIFYLRVEDTDKKREVEGAIKIVTDSLAHFDITPDEGEMPDGQEQGAYGPYKQSERAGIYKTFVKKLLEEGKAYPCFCSAEELETMRKTQEEQGVRPGYYGEWAKWRDASDEEIAKELEAGKEYVIRFKSPGNSDHRIQIEDLLLGKRELPENDQDIVIMKSDGLPTYHMAHIVDDHLMKTTHVLRGNEWFSSLPLHIQLFETMGWQAPKFGHIFPIQKMDGTSKRKLSKRKDPEANIEYYNEQGYPKDAVVEYLLNLANSNFEDWRKQNPATNYKEFPLAMKKLASSSGPLFDFTKLDDVSKEIIASYSAEKVYEYALEWAQIYDAELAALMQQDADAVKKILNIERNIGPKSRKDISKWSEIKNELTYFFDEHFSLSKEEAMAQLADIDATDIPKMVAAFEETYNEQDTKDEWFEKVKTIARNFNYADSAKAFKKEPEKFKGNVGQVAKIFRVALTGRTQTPDLHSIMQVMGRDRVMKRLNVLL